MELFLLSCIYSIVYCSTYTIPLLGHGSEDETYNDRITLQLTNPSNYNITVTISVGINTVANVRVYDRCVNFYNLTLNEFYHPVQSQIKNHTVRASSVSYFGLQVITTVNGHIEGFQAISNDLLGTEYYASTFCEFGEFCQLVIGSTVEGTTQVYVELPQEVDEISFCIGNGTWFSDSSTTIRIVYPEMVQLETTHDLTGTRIYANNTVSVLAGSRTPNSAIQKYHLVEQLVPVSDWGTEFYVRPVGSTSYGNIVHITSRYRRTFVSMTGYPNVELAGTGQTIKRRIDPTTEIRIHASRIIQVVLYTGFTYTSNETITKPGMTLVPAVEQYVTNYCITCESIDNDLSAWQVQVVAPYGVTISGISGSFAIYNVSYEQYQIMEYTQRIGPNYKCISSSTGVFSGIMNCKGSAIFPLGILSKRTPSCVSTEYDMHLGDGIDNDCDGSIDEDFCFENKRFETTFSITNGEPVSSYIHVENIIDWRVIKLRIRSCGDVKLELIAYNSANEVAGKFVISITKMGYVVYRCFPDCQSSVYKQTWDELQNADYDTLVPYWISTNTAHICFDVGVDADFGCSSSQILTIEQNTGVNELALHGQNSNAVFYYDVIRLDCGGLYSDWRCVDLVNNCWEYEDDMCTAYADWANVYCRKFCHICTPDNIGKMFKIKPPRHTQTLELYAIPDSTSIEHISITANEGKTYGFEDSSLQTKNGSSMTIKRSLMDIRGQTPRQVHTIYSDADIHLFARIQGYYGAHIIPVYPFDTFGTEYMAISFFSTKLTCDIIASNGAAKVWKSTKNHTTYLGVISGTHILQLSDEEVVGTVINSSRPVGVFCYHNENNAIQHWTQLFPTSSFGKTYRVPNFATTNSTNNISITARIMTNNANTRIQFTGDFDALYILNERGDYIDVIISADSGYTITSNNQICVAILCSFIGSGTTTFSILPPVDNYSDNPVIMSIASNASHGVNIVTKNGDMIQEPVSPIIDMFYHVEKSSSFAISVISDSNNSLSTETMLYLSTHLVKDLNQEGLCTITKGVPGDGIDNDCDGLVDEETECFTGYGSSQEDYDLDGWFGEDCLTSIAVSPVISPPAIPTCYTPPPTPPSHNSAICWVTECQCSCEWTEALAKYQNMSQVERYATNMVRIQEYRKILQINSRSLSTTVSEKISAEDTRTSSANIGYAGICLLLFLGGMIIFFDLHSLFRYLRNKRKTAVRRE